MIIKHFAGYGKVTATKECLKRDAEHDLTRLTVKVKGNHEWGLIRNDDHRLVKEWLVDVFDKRDDLDPYVDMAYEISKVGYENGEEYAIYDFLYGHDLRNVC